MVSGEHSRRSMIRAAAWGVPAVALASAAPAWAVSQPALIDLGDLTDQTCREDGAIVWLRSRTGPVPAGVTLTVEGLASASEDDIEFPHWTTRSAQGDDAVFTLNYPIQAGHKSKVVGILRTGTTPHRWWVTVPAGYTATGPMQGTIVREDGACPVV